MNFKKAAALVLTIVTITAAVGCGSSIDNNGSVKSETDTSTTTTAQSAAADEKSEADSPEKTFDSQTITASTPEYVKYSKTAEAESGKLGKNVTKADKRKGYKGKGYVKNVSAVADWSMSFSLKNKQYYNISITAAADKAVNCTVLVNGNAAGVIAIDKSGKFSDYVIKNFYIGEKNVVLTLSVADSEKADIDRVQLTSSNEIQNMKFSAAGNLSNTSSDYMTKAVYSYLCSSYGKNILLGQYDTIGTTTETDMIKKTTGKLPAIRFGDMMMSTSSESGTSAAEVSISSQWWAKGGLVGYMWHWTAPMEEAEYYSDSTDFKLKKAVTTEDIATKSLSELEELQKSGKISAECLAIVKDIDKVSQQLAKLRDNGVTVLWRPLHEASNGEFWWGEDKAAYKWLWKLMYTRQTKYHKLNNLIWVWSAQNADWYVGDNYCDILSCDVYDELSKDGQPNIMLFLKSISDKKLVTMSECGRFPDIQKAADERAMWSYIGQWGGNYLMTDEGKLSEEHNTVDELVEMYNNNITVTRDELPDFTHLASEIQTKEKAVTVKVTKKAN